MEATECGAASLSMILGYYGKFLPLEQLRIETGVSRDGCNMKNIMRAGRKLGLEVHGYRKEFNELFEMPVPSIIHWNFHHFVVWEGRKGKYCYINDPAVGRRKLTVQELDDSFTGVIMTFEPTEEFTKTKKTDTLFSFLMERLNGQKTEIAALILLGLFLVIPGIIVPAFSRIFVDDILIGGNDTWMTKLALAMLITAAFKCALIVYRSVLLQKLQKRMILMDAKDFVHHMFRLPINFFSQRYAGDLSQRIQNNNSVIFFLTGDLAENLLNCLVMFFYMIILFMYSPVLTCIGVAVVLFNAFVMYRCSKYIQDMSMKSQQDKGELVGSLFAGLSITSTLKASGTENEYISRLLGSHSKVVEMEQTMGLRQESLNAIPQVTQNILDIVILTIGGVMVIRGELTMGMLVAFTGLLTSFTEPVGVLAGFIQKIQTTRSDMARVNDILKYKEDDKFDEAEHEDLTGKLTGRVRLDKVAFGYDILKEPLIKDFSFELKSGCSIALVGASGSGKSTVAKLCSGLFSPWEGEIIFDGIPVKKIPPEVLSASISTVSQEINLFSGTIRDNLTMWNKYVMDKDMVQAAKDACIHDYITSHPGAYDYVLSEGGRNLSGGQKQRIEIARALVSDPSILIMDEATSALDPVTEKEVLDNIKRRGCTCIIVAHRLSAIRDCDEIIVMEQGKIVQRGTHDELAVTEGHYKRLIQNI